MKVFLVIEHTEYESDNVVLVCSTFSIADNRAKELAKTTGADFVDVEEWPVDSDIPFDYIISRQYDRVLSKGAI